jgi:hypothetical protein
MDRSAISEAAAAPREQARIPSSHPGCLNLLLLGKLSRSFGSPRRLRLIRIGRTIVFARMRLICGRRPHVKQDRSEERHQASAERHADEGDDRSVRL